MHKNRIFLDVFDIIFLYECVNNWKMYDIVLLIKHIDF